MTKPRYVYSGNQVREMDREAVAGPEVSGWELMERAGRSAFALLIETWQEAEKLQVICGTGACASARYCGNRDTTRILDASVPSLSRARRKDQLIYSNVDKVFINACQF